jgi:hypothetical protein
MSVKTSAQRESRRADRASETRAGQPKAGGFEVLLLLIAVIGGLQLLTLVGLEANRIVRARHEIHQLSNSVAVLQSQNEQLQAVIAHAGDQSYREALARLQGFVYPKEKRYVIAPGKTEP